MEKDSMSFSGEPYRDSRHPYKDERIRLVRNLPHDEKHDPDDFKTRLIQAIPKLLLPFFIAISVTPFCIYLAMKSGAAGHGKYIMAKMFFPYTMISTCFFDTITIPFAILAIVELPVYGIVIGIAWYRRSLIRCASVLLTVHAVSTLVSLVLVKSF